MKVEMSDIKSITQPSLPLMAPDLFFAVALGQGSIERRVNLAVVEVRCFVCDEANNVQPSCLILDIWPQSTAGIVLLSYHLSSPSNL